jgi:enediyne core biosynthesis thioesterase
VRAYVYHHVVTLDETNAVGNVYFAHFLHWQGHCRERFLADHAPGALAALSAGQLALVTVSCDMEYYAECFGLDTLDVRMTLAAQSGHRIGMHFEFVRGGEQVARGRQTVACMRRSAEGLRPLALPADLRAALAQFSG